MKGLKNMKDEIRGYIKSLEVEDVGFASVKDYISPNSPKIESFFPKAKSIIVMAYRELSTCESLHPQMAMNGRMDKDALIRCNNYKIGHFLEDNFKAKIVSIPTATPLMGGKGVVSLRHAAVAAGLGNFGRHNLVIHPKFGTRVTFSAIVTNLEIDSDEKIKENFCNNCNVCVKNCPAKALEEEGKTDVMKCIKVSQPFSFLSQLSFLEKFIDENKEKRKEMIKDYWPFYQANSIGIQYYCFNCLKLCPACGGNNAV